MANETVEDLARKNLLCFARYMNPKYDLPKHWKYIAKRLEAVARGECKRLMLSVPPQHGKSELANKLFISWFLGNHADKSIIMATYGNEFANERGGYIRDVMATDKYKKLFPESMVSKNSAVKYIKNGQGGCVYSVSLDQAITGRPAHLIVIDDPFKGLAEVNSPVKRQQVKDNYIGGITARIQDETAIVIINTRWHEDDLTGWLAKIEPNTWEIINFPAIAEENDVLGRDVGEALWSEKHAIEGLIKKRTSMGGSFSALYQGHPQPKEGGIFKRDTIRYYEKDDIDADSGRIVLSFDTANKESELSDYSVCTVWKQDKSNFYLLDLWRGRVGINGLVEATKGLAYKWKPKAVLIEDRASGTQLLQMLRGLNMSCIPIYPKDSKVIRANNVAPVFESGRVYFPKNASWLTELEDELFMFPSSTHRDQVDSITQFLQWGQGRGMVVNVAPISFTGSNYFAG